MKNKISKAFGFISSAGAVGVSLLPLISLAQISGASNPALPPPVNPTFQTLSNALCTVIGWIFVGLMILTVIFILWAAWYYLSSNGEEEKVKKANHMLLYAGIAVIVAIISRAFPFLIGTLLNAPNFTSAQAGCF